MNGVQQEVISEAIDKELVELEKAIAAARASYERGNYKDARWRVESLEQDHLERILKLLETGAEVAND